MTSPSAAPLRVAVLGAGSAALAVHLPLLARHAAVRVTAVAEPDPARRALAGAVAPTAALYDDWRYAIAATDVDAVVVCLPTALHADAACTALAARKHLYLEKPIAHSVTEGVRVVEAWHAAGVVGMTGFNYRCNPLFQRLRQRIVAREQGDTVVVRTTFCSLPDRIPEWKRARATGGGVLLDLGSHHVDLLRFLFAADVQDVRGSVWGAREEGDSALLELVLTNGVRAHCTFSLSAPDEDRVEVLGTRAVLSVDRHGGVDVATRRAAGSLAGSVRERVQALARQGYRLRKRREPWHEPSFARALDVFVDAARANDHAVTPSLLDGLRALEVVDAAERSSASGGFLAVTARAEAPSPAAARAPAIRISSATTSMSDSPEQPSLSVVLITPGNFQAIRTTVEHLRDQTVRSRLELLIITPSRAVLRADESLLAAFRWVRIVETDAIQATGPARALAVREARAPVIVYAEDHCFPDPGWAEALLAAHEHDYAAVGPVIRNANPDGAVSWADLLIGYGPWLAPGRAGPVDQLPGHNSSYKREVLLAYGDRLADMLDAETVLQWDLRANGHTLYLEPAATAAHTNFARYAVWLPATYHHGRVFGATRAEGWSAGRRAAFTLASPLIPLVRFSRAFRQGRAAGLPTGLLLRVVPALLGGLVIDGVGQMVGYATGAGGSRDILGTFEFHRVDRNRAPTRALEVT